MVITLEWDPVGLIGIFPAFYSVDRTATLHQVVKSLDKEPLCLSMDKISDLSIYLNDCSEMATIHELAKTMAVSFPQITTLIFYLKHRCEIVSFFPDYRWL